MILCHSASLNSALSEQTFTHYIVSCDTLLSGLFCVMLSAVLVSSHRIVSMHLYALLTATGVYHLYRIICCEMLHAYIRCPGQWRGLRLIQTASSVYVRVGECICVLESV